MRRVGRHWCTTGPVLCAPPAICSVEIKRAVGASVTLLEEWLQLQLELELRVELVYHSIYRILFDFDDAPMVAPND